jgi:lysophospholipase L1-like esterase
MSVYKPVLAVLVLGFALIAPNSAQTPSVWVGTWSASPMLADGGFHVHSFSGTTLRQIAHITIGGKAVRVRFTNEFGLEPLTLTDAHFALSGGGSSILPGSDHPLTFGGAATVKIPPGAVLFSDPLQFAVTPQANVAVSFFVPSQIMRAETYHDFANQDNFIVDGDASGAAALPNATIVSSWYFFDGLEVSVGDQTRSIVTLGDSITDGSHSTRNANRRWPDILASRLQESPALRNLSVLNVGIGGNRVVNDGNGPNALARLNRDVLAQDGVKYLIVLEGINDIGRLARMQGPDDEISSEQLELALGRIADAAHQHGVKIFGATLTPYGGAGYFSDKGEEIRKRLNDWIRSSGPFDGVIDFDKITRDPQNPDRFNPLFDCGDHLHPNDAGYEAMGNGIDLALFAR